MIKKLFTNQLHYLLLLIIPSAMISMFTGAVILVTEVEIPGAKMLGEDTVVAVIVVFVVAILVGTK